MKQKVRPNNTHTHTLICVVNSIGNRIIPIYNEMSMKISRCSNYKFNSLKNVSTANVLCAPAQAIIVIDHI